MAVGCNSPKTGKSAQTHAHSIVSTKTGAKGRGAGGIYPALPREWDKNRITWSLAKVKHKKLNFPHFLNFKGPTSSMIGDVEVRYVTT